MNTESFPVFLHGSVWLVGAGPGDPGLLTLLALHALNHADVIVHDALVDERIMSLSAPDVVHEFAGKRGGKPSSSQRDITERLIELARQGKRVLRLKGGDPFVFGRGAEEAIALREAGIPFRIVPGITAGIGGLAYANIPATVRGSNQAVIFATGHAAVESCQSLDWEALARTGAPIILYMGLTHLAGISEALMRGGMASETPAAIVSRAASPNQRTLVSTLGHVASEARRHDMEAPAIIAIGANVSLRDLIDSSSSGDRL